MGEDLFTQDNRGRIAVHVATDTVIILLFSKWMRGWLHHSVLVPQRGGNGLLVFCNATYSDYELELTNEFLS